MQMAYATWGIVAAAAYVVALGGAEAKQVRNADVGALFLHPDVGRDLATKLLIYRACVPGFRELPRHGAAENELARQAVRLDVDRDADVEAALDPLVRLLDGAFVAAAEPQVQPSAEKGSAD